MSHEKATDIAKRILEEQSGSASIQRANVTSKYSDAMKPQKVKDEASADGNQDKSETDSQSKQKKNVSSKRSATSDKNELVDGNTENHEINPEGNDFWYGEFKKSTVLGEEEEHEYDENEIIFEESDDDDDDDDDDDASEDSDDESNDDDDDDDDDVIEEALRTANTSTPIAEHTNALFEGSDALTEEYRDRATTLFEAAVIERSRTVAKIIQEKCEKKVNKRIKKLQETYESRSADLVEQVNNYLDYVVGEWLEENRLQVENGLRNEITENFINGLKNLFAENYIDVPAEKVDILSDIQAKLEEKTDRLNDSLKKLAEAKLEAKNLKKQILIQECTAGMSAVRKQKLLDLAEGVSFNNEADFKKKLEVLKETYASDRPKAPRTRDGSQDTVRTLTEVKEEFNFDRMDIPLRNSIEGSDEVNMLSESILKRFGPSTR